MSTPIEKIHVTRLKSVFDTQPKPYPLTTIFKEIRYGNTTIATHPKYKTLADMTRYARNVLLPDPNPEKHKNAYDAVKRSAPQFVPAANLLTRSEVAQLSDIVCVEFDNPDIDTPYVLASAAQDPHCLAAFRSFSGKPKLLIRLAHTSTDGELLSIENFQYAWASAARSYQEFGDADFSASKVTQLQALVHDPNIYIYAQPMPLKWQVDEETFLQEWGSEYKSGKRAEITALAELPVEYQEEIKRIDKAREWKENGWCKKSVPCPFDSNHEYDGWERKTNGTRIKKNADNDYTFVCHKCKKSIRFTDRQRTAPDRLHITDTPPQTATYEKTQADMTQQLMAWEKKSRDTDSQHLLNIITPAQTGKTTVTITTAEKLTYITQTQNKAEEAHSEAISAGKNAYLHKSRLWNRDNPNWENLPFGTDTECRPCLHPEICNTIAAKGFPPVKEFCRVQCAEYDLCKTQGYLSQLEKEKHTDHVYFWQGETFFADEIYRSRVQNVMGDEECILVIDEPNPADLAQQRIINLEALRRTLNNIKYSPNMSDISNTSDIAQFLKDLIERLATPQTPEEIRSALEIETLPLSDTDINAFDDRLSKIPVHFVWKRTPNDDLVAEVIYDEQTITCPVAQDDDNTTGTIPESIIGDGVTLDKPETRFISLSLFEKFGFINLRKGAEQAPRVYRNLISDIKHFVDSNSHACHRTDENVIVFYLPPNINARRGIAMNASDTDNLIGEVYRNTSIIVETITGNPPPWKPGCQLFQVSTGRYSLGISKADPQRSLFIVENNIPTGVKPTLRDFQNIILNTAEKYNALVIGAKRLQDTTIDPLLAQINAHENITIDTHIGAQGKNEYQDRDVVFVFCFEPNPNIIEAEAKRIYRHARDLSFDRDTRDVTVDGVTLTDVMRYTDIRVQKIYNLHCEKAHMQAILRLRQALNKNKTAILFSAEPVSQMPATPIKFRKEQLLAFQETPNWQLSELQQYLKAEENRTPTEIAEAEGINIRTAYRKTELTRKMTKSDKKTKAKALRKQGIPVDKICAELDIKSKQTFYNWEKNNFE